MLSSKPEPCIGDGTSYQVWELGPLSDIKRTEQQLDSNSEEAKGEKAG